MATDNVYLLILLMVLGAITFKLIQIFWRIIENNRNRSKFVKVDNQAPHYESSLKPNVNTPQGASAQTGIPESEVVAASSTELNRRAADETPLRHSVAISTKSLPPSRGTGLMIFISYRRQDSGDITGRIYDRLVRHFSGKTIFKDVDSIPLGVDFRKSLGDAVGQCNLLLAVIGRQWLNSQNEGGAWRLDDPRDFVRIEIEAALQREIPVIPLLVQGAGMPGESELPPSMQALVYRNAISIRPDPDFHHDVDRLIKGIELHFNNNS